MTTSKDLPGMGTVEVITSRRLMREGGLVAVAAEDSVVPASEAKQLKARIRDLERLLGKKTMEAEILREAIEIARRNGERIRVVFSMDCCDREVIGYLATTKGIDAEMVKELMVETVEARFANVERTPHRVEWLTDNGSAFTAHDARSFAVAIGLSPCTMPVRSPESNGMAESFVRTFKRDCH